MEQQTDNELIAEFMGLERSKDIWDQGQHAYTMKFPSVFNKLIVPSEMLFDASWDWLMPVVEKIREKYGASDHDKSINTAVDNLRVPLLFTTIESAYISVVEFIKWFNQQKV